MAFPQDKIRFYADPSHIEAIKNIFVYDCIAVDNIEYCPIKFYDPYTLHGMIAFRNLCKRLFTEMLSAGTNKLFFLSIEPPQLWAIKQLMANSRYCKIRCTFVLHGSFERIAHNKYQELPRSVFPAIPLSKRIKAIKYSEFPRKSIRFLKTRINLIISGFYSAYSQPFKNWFHFKKVILWRHSNDYHYIALSPHILPNAREYIDVDNLNFHAIVIPIVFAKPMPQPRNEFVKFAVFGFGDSAALYKLGLLLSNRQIHRPYEIRVIGMDNRGTEKFPNFKCASPGKLMPRQKMEKNAEDIDVFLILYDKNRYRLSCSLSILEALSYTKPILHLPNDCINNFNKLESPIGFSCITLEEMADKMADVIENYSAYKPQLQIFRNNILKLREEFAIENLAPKIKESFSFEI